MERDPAAVIGDHSIALHPLSHCKSQHAHAFIAADAKQRTQQPQPQPQSQQQQQQQPNDALPRVPLHPAPSGSVSGGAVGTKCTNKLLRQDDVLAAMNDGDSDDDDDDMPLGGYLNKALSRDTVSISKDTCSKTVSVNGANKTAATAGALHATASQQEPVTNRDGLPAIGMQQRLPPQRLLSKKAALLQSQQSQSIECEAAAGTVLQGATNSAHTDGCDAVPTQCAAATRKFSPAGPHVTGSGKGNAAEACVPQTAPAAATGCYSPAAAPPAPPAPPAAPAAPAAHLPGRVVSSSGACDIQTEPPEWNSEHDLHRPCVGSFSHGHAGSPHSRRTRAPATAAVTVGCGEDKENPTVSFDALHSFKHADLATADDSYTCSSPNRLQDWDIQPFRRSGALTRRRPLTETQAPPGSQGLTGSGQQGSGYGQSQGLAGCSDNNDDGAAGDDRHQGVKLNDHLGVSPNSDVFYSPNGSLSNDSGGNGDSMQKGGLSPLEDGVVEFGGKRHVNSGGSMSPSDPHLGKLQVSFGWGGRVQHTTTTVCVRTDGNGELHAYAAVASL